MTVTAGEAAFSVWGKDPLSRCGHDAVGGVWTLFSLRKSLLRGIKSGFAAARRGRSGWCRIPSATPRR